MRSSVLTLCFLDGLPKHAPVDLCLNRALRQLLSRRNECTERFPILVRERAIIASPDNEIRVCGQVANRLDALLGSLSHPASSLLNLTLLREKALNEPLSGVATNADEHLGGGVNLKGLAGRSDGARDDAPGSRSHP